VRFDGPAAAWARERHPAADVTERPDGSVVVRVPCPSPVWLAGWVVSFAGRARVIGPPELRAEVARRLKTAFGRTAAGSGLATLVDTPVPLR
jgi:predicted DNA-binding transcriptional regulator YafY